MLHSWKDEPVEIDPGFEPDAVERAVHRPGVVEAVEKARVQVVVAAGRPVLAAHDLQLGDVVRAQNEADR